MDLDTKRARKELRRYPRSLALRLKWLDAKIEQLASELSMLSFQFKRMTKPVRFAPNPNGGANGA